MTARWTIDPMHSSVTFTVRHLLITTIRGSFDDISGSLLYDPGQLETASISVEIPAALINTRQAQRDEHLRSSDFFDAVNHPMITFRSRRFRRDEVVGELSMRGVTREVTLALDELSGEQLDHRGTTRIGASATARVKRSDFGMTYNRVIETGGVAIADEVVVTLDVSLVKEG